MKDLLRTYSLSQILTFIVVLAVAIKGTISFFDWTKDRLKKIFDKEYKTENEKNRILKELQYDKKRIDTILEDQEDILNKVTDMTDKVDMLIQSDKDNIKAFLTKEHHYYCYQKGWIDDYSLECCERRYQQYKKEGGNSFIQGFMEELRALPKYPDF